jgi:hypothetical protein
MTFYAIVRRGIEPTLDKNGVLSTSSELYVEVAYKDNERLLHFITPFDKIYHALSDDIPVFPIDNPCGCVHTIGDIKRGIHKVRYPDSMYCLCKEV